MDVNIRIAGEAGQGVQTTGDMLVGAFAGLGLHVWSNQTYMSRIRGGLNWFDVRIADRELFSGREKADLLIALSKDALDALRPTVSQGGIALFDGQGGDGVVSVELSKTATDAGGSPLMANTVAAGAVFAILGYDVERLCDFLRPEFEKKGDEVVQKNILCARRGADAVAPQAGTIRGPAGTNAPATVYSGAEAVGLGAATAGVRFVTAYPMTPSTGTFTWLAANADKYGILVEQAEDEIAAINMVCGAVYAGVPAMTMTSGGGFALMVEGVSLAGMLELPALVLVGQRPGPATGLPTRTAQQDLRFVMHAGHGEFPRAIFAPGTLQQAYDLTRRACETAHKFQSPAFILSDQYLADLRKNIPPLDAALRPINRCIEEHAGADYMRYAVTESGVSPRAIPGGDALVVVDSDEHTEDGHITEDLKARVRLQDKRMRKGMGMTAEALPPEWYGPREAEQVFLAWGSTYGPCREAVDTLNERGGSAAMAHFAQLWPINVPAVRAALHTGGGGARRFTSVECNATGQLASVLRERSIMAECALMLKYDGMPFTGEEIVARAAK